MAKRKDGKSSNQPSNRISNKKEAARLDLERRAQLSDANTSSPSQKQIVDRAFLLWQKRGFSPDQEELCWFQAEAELKREG